jgi:predicted TIM-barrel fold metal-dependent hydrolase
VKITDSQVHVWEAEQPDRPWPKTGNVPDWALTPYTAEDLIADMDEAGVTRAFLVPPAFDGGRNDYALAAAQRYVGRLAVMGRLQLSDPSAAEHLAAWKEQPHGYGMRFVFFSPEQQAQLTNGTIDWLWPLAQRLEIPLTIYPALDLFKDIGAIANRYSSLKITVDLMAVSPAPHDRDEAAFRHLEQLLNLAPLPNVAVKASALPEASTGAHPYSNLHPYIRRTVDAFGPERVFWGTDITRLDCSYEQAITMFTEHMTWLNERELRLIMDEAVRRWHGWEPVEDC